MWKPSVAYFSMEIAIDELIPTDAGGLGVLAGDKILSAADEEIPLVAVKLVHHEGYFDQTLRHFSQDALHNSLTNSTLYSNSR